MLQLYLKSLQLYSLKMTSLYVASYITVLIADNLTSIIKNSSSDA